MVSQDETKDKVMVNLDVSMKYLLNHYHSVEEFFFPIYSLILSVISLRKKFLQKVRKAKWSATFVSINTNILFPNS